MHSQSESRLWALEEFGHAELGDARRTQRLVRMAEQLCARPAGKLTQVFSDGAQREGAFRFLENDQVAPDALGLSAWDAACRRSQPFPLVYVALDQTKLSIVDRLGCKGLGDVGTIQPYARGLQVLSALALDPETIPLGLVHQQYWARHVGPKQPVQARRDKLPEQKETGYFLHALTQSADRFEQQAPQSFPWFQIDRGGDAWPLLWRALSLRGLLTVRAAWDRRLWRHPEQAQPYLWGHLGQQEPLGSYLLHVPAGPSRSERDAVLQLRAAKVELDLKDHLHNQHHRMPLWAVLCREEEPPPGERPLQWMLLTTYPVKDAASAQHVVFAYSLRWRVEDFHCLWKSGACQVESTQLRHKDRIVRWAMLLSSVAVRIQRLTLLAREHPELPATVELEQAEIDAAMVGTEQKKWRPGQVPSLGEAVLWIAQLGGYTGKSSGGPPGARVLARGLQRIELLASYFASQHRQSPRSD